MSRIGKKPIVIPAGVTVTVNGSHVEVKGPKGTLVKDFDPIISINVGEKEITFTRPNDGIKARSLHGTTRALVNSMVVGVSEGFKKNLEIVGIGYRGAMRGDKLVLNLGYSHEIVVTPDAGVKISSSDPLKITVEGIDAQAVGQTAARIRSYREPEPYGGKGVRYEGEYVLRKEGKRASKK